MENPDPLDADSQPRDEIAPASPPAEPEMEPAEKARPEEPEEASPPPRRLGINIPFTIVVALLMFLAGSMAGYFGRPFISPTPTPTPDQKQALLNMLIGKTRHWKGNAGAPVVILEFSDFQ